MFPSITSQCFYTCCVGIAKGGTFICGSGMSKSEQGICIFPCCHFCLLHTLTHFLVLCCLSGSNARYIDAKTTYCNVRWPFGSSSGFSISLSFIIISLWTGVKIFIMHKVRFLSLCGCNYFFYGRRLQSVLVLLTVAAAVFSNRLNVWVFASWIPQCPHFQRW